MQLPKIIHFIWAGGEQLLPQREANVIKSWAKKAFLTDPNFKIYLWTDKKTTSEVSKYKSEKEYFQETDNIKICDIGKYREDYIAYELDRLKPNYGASSDMLRYQILYEHGGAYFDSDIRPINEDKEDKDPVLEIFNETFAEDKILFISANSQNRNQPNSNTISVGNDNFITSANNDIFFQFYEECKKNYKNPDLIDVERYDDVEYIKTNTLEKTGSGVMKPVFTSIKLASLTEEKKRQYLSEIEEKKKQLFSKGVKKDEKPLSEQEQTEQIKAMLSNYRTKKDFEAITEVVFLEDKLKDKLLGEKCFEFTTIENELTSKLKSHTSLWTKVPVTRQIDGKECFDKVAEIIEFEAENFKIFRIKNHVQNCLQALNFDDNDSNKQEYIFLQLKERIQDKKYLDKIDPKKIQTLSGFRLEGALNQLKDPLKKLLLPIKEEDRSKKSDAHSVQERSFENTVNATITSTGSTYESGHFSTNENLQENEQSVVGTSSEEDWDKEFGINPNKNDDNVTSTPLFEIISKSLKGTDLKKEEDWHENPEITGQENKNENRDAESSQLAKKAKFETKKEFSP